MHSCLSNDYYEQFHGDGSHFESNQFSKYVANSELLSITAYNDYTTNTLAIGGKSLIRVLKINEYSREVELAEDLLELSKLNNDSKKLGVMNDIRFGFRAFQDKLAAASTSGSIFIIDIKRRLDVQEIKAHRRAINTIAFSQHDQGNLILSGSQDGSIRLWDLRVQDGASSSSNVSLSMKKYQVRPSYKFLKQNDEIRCNEFSPHDSNIFCSVSTSGHLTKWDLRAPNRFVSNIRSAHINGALTLEWNQSLPYIVTGGNDSKVKVWNMTKDWVKDPEYQISVNDNVSKVSWCPSDNYNKIEDCNLACSYLTYNCSVDVWDLKRKFLQSYSLQNHTQPVTGLHWHTENTLWTVSKDRSFIGNNLLNEVPYTSSLRKNVTRFNPVEYSEFITVYQKENSFIKSKSSLSFYDEKTLDNSNNNSNVSREILTTMPSLSYRNSEISLFDNGRNSPSDLFNLSRTKFNKSGTMSTPLSPSDLVLSSKTEKQKIFNYPFEKSSPSSVLNNLGISPGKSPVNKVKVEEKIGNDSDFENSDDTSNDKLSDESESEVEELDAEDPEQATSTKPIDDFFDPSASFSSKNYFNSNTLFVDKDTFNLTNQSKPPSKQLDCKGNDQRKSHAKKLSVSSNNITDHSNNKRSLVGKSEEDDLLGARKLNSVGEVYTIDDQITERNSISVSIPRGFFDIETTNVINYNESPVPLLYMSNLNTAFDKLYQVEDHIFNGDLFKMFVKNFYEYLSTFADGSTDYNKILFTNYTSSVKKAKAKQNTEAKSPFLKNCLSLAEEFFLMIKNDEFLKFINESVRDCFKLGNLINLLRIIAYMFNFKSMGFEIINLLLLLKKAVTLSATYKYFRYYKIFKILLNSLIIDLENFLVSIDHKSYIKTKKSKIGPQVSMNGYSFSLPNVATSADIEFEKENKLFSSNDEINNFLLFQYTSDLSNTRPEESRKYSNNSSLSFGDRTFKKISPTNSTVSLDYHSSSVTEEDDQSDSDIEFHDHNEVHVVDGGRDQIVIDTNQLDSSALNTNVESTSNNSNGKSNDNVLLNNNLSEPKKKRLVSGSSINQYGGDETDGNSSNDSMSDESSSDENSSTSNVNKINGAYSDYAETEDDNSYEDEESYTYDSDDVQDNSAVRSLAKGVSVVSTTENVKIGNKIVGDDNSESPISVKSNPFSEAEDILVSGKTDIVYSYNEPKFLRKTRLIVRRNSDNFNSINTTKPGLEYLIDNHNFSKNKSSLSLQIHSNSFGAADKKRQQDQLLQLIQVSDTNSKLNLLLKQDKGEVEEFIDHDNMTNDFTEKVEKPWKLELLIHNAVESSRDQGDVLMLAMLTLLFFDYFDKKITRSKNSEKQHLEVSKRQGYNFTNYLITRFQAKTWLHMFLDELFAKDLTVIAALITKYCPIEEIKNRGLVDTEIKKFCPHCEKLIINEETIRKNTGESKNCFWFCDNCNHGIGTCIYCNVTLKGLTIGLLNCGHQGHLRCMKKWFCEFKEIECPGCGEVPIELEQLVKNLGITEG